MWRIEGKAHAYYSDEHGGHVWEGNKDEWRVLIFVKKGDKRDWFGPYTFGLIDAAKQYVEQWKEKTAP